MSSERFLGMTKIQFSIVSALLSAMAVALAAVSIGFWIHSIQQRRADFCQAVDTMNASIRKVLDDGIKNGRAELKDPRFAKYKDAIERSIRNAEKYKAELFANRAC